MAKVIVKVNGNVVDCDYYSFNKIKKMQTAGYTVIAVKEAK